MTRSIARARPSVWASNATVPEPNVSRTGLARSATRETRRTASISEAAGISARQPYSTGNRDSYLMNSPAISRPVSRRPPLSNEIIPSTGRGSPRPVVRASSGAAKATETGTPGTMTRAASAMVRPGTRAIARIPGCAGAQCRSRTASRYRSVAASVTTSPRMSRHTPVSIGSVSSRLVAGSTCATAAARSPPSTVPASGGAGGSSGYSAVGSETSANSALPQLSVTSSPSERNSAGCPGRLRVISASSRPGTSAEPGSSISAGSRVVAESS